MASRPRSLDTPAILNHRATIPAPCYRHPSMSGASDELLALAPCARAKGAQLISLTSAASGSDCPLAAACDLNVHLPLQGEVCPFGLAPVTSTAIQMVFGDTVVAAIMEARRLTRDQYASNHPAGKIGKTLIFKGEVCPFGLAPVTSTAIQMVFGDTVVAAIMEARRLTRDQYASNHPAGKIGKTLIFKVKDVMKKQNELPLCKEGDMIMDQLTELTSKGCGCLLVVDDEYHLIGTFTDGDLRRTLKASGPAIFSLTVGEMCNSRGRIWKTFWNNSLENGKMGNNIHGWYHSKKISSIFGIKNLLKQDEVKHKC
uniref:Uncharacterized protein n=1 Tax=Aegilops tauschii TaxID=37682 RepID=N1R0I6_AEGTA